MPTLINRKSWWHCFRKNWWPK